MTILGFALILAVLLCSLTAGFLFAFAVVAMPGMKSLSDGEFIRAFQGMDGIIQNSHPLFLLVWLGSIASIIASAVLGAMQLGGPERAFLILATTVYLLAVQLPTFLINIPLNNFIQSVDTTSMSEAELKEARQRFEPRWNQWNNLRTVFSCMTAILLIAVLYRL